jgi:hypothetical protein
MRIFVVKAFGRFQRREKITDAMLCSSIDDAAKGLIDADLGGDLVKQRIARKGQGKRGGFRAYVAFRSNGRAVFLYGFPKSEREDIKPDELADLKLYAGRWLGLDDDTIERAIADDDLREVFCGEGSKKA